MDIFKSAAARLLATSQTVQIDVDMAIEVEFVPQLTIAEMAIRMVNEIGARGLLQELA